MEFVTLGRWGLRASRLGFGCAAIGGYDYGHVDVAESIAAVHKALDAGINLFDTAAVYGLGRSEVVLGRALAGRRGEAVIATKCGLEWDERGRTRRNGTPNRIASEVDGSLRRLGVDRIDLYQLHWPDPETPLSESLDALERLRETGKVNAVGLCNVPTETAARLAGRMDTLQLPFSLVDRRHEEGLRSCRERYGMGVVSYNSLGHGFLTGKYGLSTRFPDTDLRKRSDVRDVATRAVSCQPAIRKIAERHGRTSAQVAIRWACQRIPGIVVLAGAKSPRQVEDNAGAMEWALTEDELESLAASA